MQRALNASRSEFQQLKQRMVEVQGYLQHLKSRQDLLETAPPTAAPPEPKEFPEVGLGAEPAPREVCTLPGGTVNPPSAAPPPKKNAKRSKLAPPDPPLKPAITARPAVATPDVADPAAVAGSPTAAAAKMGSSGSSGASPGTSGSSGAAPAAAAAARRWPAPAQGLLTEINICCWTGQNFPIAISADALVQDLEDKIIDMLASDPTYEEAYNLAKSRGLQLIYKGRTLIHKLNKLDCYVPLANSFDIVVHVLVCKRKNPC
jgi:hypothetical protein